MRFTGGISMGLCGQDNCLSVNRVFDEKGQCYQLVE